MFIWKTYLNQVAIKEQVNKFQDLQFNRLKEENRQENLKNKSGCSLFYYYKRISILNEPFIT